MQPIRFLALGDSYTIGESVPVEESWPLQLASRLRECGLPLEDPIIVARTGWTTAELREGIARAEVQGCTNWFPSKSGLTTNTVENPKKTIARVSKPLVYFNPFCGR
jgi:hypothetical protein